MKFVAGFHVMQVFDYYYRAVMFFMTSAFKGFANTLIEAHSYAAVPVVFDSYPVAGCILDVGRAWSGLAVCVA